MILSFDSNRACLVWACKDEVCVSCCRGDAAKTNFPLSDYTPEMEALQAQSFDSLVADLRAEVSIIPSLLSIVPLLVLPSCRWPLHALVLRNQCWLSKTQAFPVSLPSAILSSPGVVQRTVDLSILSQKETTLFFTAGRGEEWNNLFSGHNM